MINKNKEEIEKIEKGCKSIEWGCLPKRLCPYCQRAKQERIKTSIEWCEDEIEFVQEILNQNPNYVNQEDAEIKISKLQSHLKWLKQKRGQDD